MMRRDLDRDGLHVNMDSIREDEPMPEYNFVRTQPVPLAETKQLFDDQPVGVIEAMPVDYPMPDSSLVVWLRSEQSKGKYILIDKVLERL